MPQTTFDPARDGFAFANDFDTRPVADVSIRGLCGGMVYTVLDYLAAGRPCPQGPRPADGSPLHRHLEQRNLSAWTSNLDKWLELTANPFGWLNDSFFAWGYQLGEGSRVDELTTAIDAGRNVPLGLFSHEDGGVPTQHHVVLAVGYELGRHRVGSEHPEDVRVRIYNPNRPGEINCLRPDLDRKLWCQDSDGDAWRTYFVDLNHRPAPPPVDEAPSTASDDRVDQLIIRLCTGSDDLRGGNDNLDVTIEFTDGATITRRNVNQGARWVDHRDQTVTVPLDRAVRTSEIKMVTLETTSGGGIGGDNWNLQWIELFTRLGPLVPRQGGDPFHRFTGDARTLMLLVN